MLTSSQETFHLFNSPLLFIYLFTYQRINILALNKMNIIYIIIKPKIFMHWNTRNARIPNAFLFHYSVHSCRRKKKIKLYSRKDITQNNLSSKLIAFVPSSDGISNLSTKSRQKAASSSEVFLAELSKSVDSERWLNGW